MAKHQRTNILPLRWIGNISSEIATYNLVKAFKLQDQDNFGYRFKFHSKAWNIFNKPYTVWGTYYTLDRSNWSKDIDDGWDNLEEFSKAYWEKDTDSDSLES